MGNQQSHSSADGTPTSTGHASPARVTQDSSTLSSPTQPTSSSSRPLAGGVSSLFGSTRDRSGSITSTLGRTKSNSISMLNGPPTPAGLVDGGHLTPQGLYALRPAAQDYSHQIVKGLILDKKLAPFYRGLEDYEDDWTDEQVMTGLKEVRAAQAEQEAAQQQEQEALAPLAGSSGTAAGSGGLAAGTLKKGLKIVGGGKDKREEKEKLADRERKEARAYKGSVECPICFLYYPPNINTSRCCEQPLCTECFVQIKRAEATITHLESESAACPYCMETEFGVIYEVSKIARPETLMATSPDSSEIVLDPRMDGQTPRRKSVSSKSKAVVTIDQIRPDWQEKLNAVKAQAARRASRRIIMHRVGDRLIPVGYTSSRSTDTGTDTGPITTEMTEEAYAQFMAGAGGRGARASNSATGGRRGSRRGETSAAVNDLEEMMIMEAMRLSMMEHEEQQRKEAEAKKKADQEARAGGASSTGAGSSESIPTAGSSFIQPRSSATSSAASSIRRSGGPIPGQPGPVLDAPFRASLDYGRGSGQPAESSPLSGTPLSRPDLINLDSDAAIATRSGQHS